MTESFTHIENPTRLSTEAVPKYRCVACNEDGLRAYSTFWECAHCGYKYPTIKGIPRLYQEKELGESDRSLRDFLYNGFLGKYYRHLMPFLALPVRPGYWNGWLAYGVIVTFLLALIVYSGNFLFFLLVAGSHLPCLMPLSLRYCSARSLFS